MSNEEFYSRYEALGLPLPDPKTMCAGECEGTGWVPVWFPPQRPGERQEAKSSITHCEPTKEDYERYYQTWLEAEQVSPADDGWHFVKCPDCGGTGKKATIESEIKA